MSAVCRSVHGSEQLRNKKRIQLLSQRWEVGNLALPHNQNLPAKRIQRFLSQAVAPRVGRQFVEPKLSI